MDATTCVTASSTGTATNTTTTRDEDVASTTIIPGATATAAASVSSSSLSSTEQQWEERILIARGHFERKGYRVHSGLQFGCELVLYADDPSKVHSDFCVHVVPADGSIDWRSMQTLVRSMPDLHKTLILAFPRRQRITDDQRRGIRLDNNDDDDDDDRTGMWVVEELALATEHAPFRHRKPSSVSAVTGTTNTGTTFTLPQGVGTQYKKRPKTRHQNDT